MQLSKPGRPQKARAFGALVQPRSEGGPQMNLKWAPVRPGGRAAGGAAAFAECKQTRMACSRKATNSHAEKSGRGAGGAGAAGGRVASGSAAFGRSTAASEQTRVM